jgi:integrase
MSSSTSPTAARTHLHLVPPLPSANDTASTPDLTRAEHYAASASAPATKRAYAADFRTFTLWAKSASLSPLPASPATITCYLAHMADIGKKPATIERALKGIASAHRAAGHPWENTSAIKETLAGIRRRLGTASHKKAPVTVDDLRRLVAAIPTSAGDNTTRLADLRDRALILLGWFGAFRRSELCALTVGDIRRTPEGIVVTVRRSKTDQDGKGMEKGIHAAEDLSMCPVAALDAWLSAAGIEEGPLFRAIDRFGRIAPGALEGKTVARIVQKLATRAGLDASQFAGHSLRAGFATAAAKAGKPLEAIMRQTGHKSVSVATGYIRPATVFCNNATEGLV